MEFPRKLTRKLMGGGPPPIHEDVPRLPPRRLRRDSARSIREQKFRKRFLLIGSAFAILAVILLFVDVRLFFCSGAAASAAFVVALYFRP